MDAVLLGWPFVCFALWIASCGCSMSCTRVVGVSRRYTERSSGQPSARKHRSANGLSAYYSRRRPQAAQQTYRQRTLVVGLEAGALSGDLTTISMDSIPNASRNSMWWHYAGTKLESVGAPACAGGGASFATVAGGVELSGIAVLDLWIHFSLVDADNDGGRAKYV